MQRGDEGVGGFAPETALVGDDGAVVVSRVSDKTDAFAGLELHPGYFERGQQRMFAAEVPTQRDGSEAVVLGHGAAKITICGKWRVDAVVHFPIPGPLRNRRLGWRMKNQSRRGT